MTPKRHRFWNVGVLFAAWLVAGPSHAAPEDFGRLFYSPAERAQLEQARTRNVTRRSTGSRDTIAQPQRYDGMVIRSDGRTTHWVDGHPQTEGVGGLKPGQTRADGNVYEPYQLMKPQPPVAAPRNPASAAP